LHTCTLGLHSGLAVCTHGYSQLNYVPCLHINFLIKMLKQYYSAMQGTAVLFVSK
jgi:hypothetical protein